MSRSRPQRSQIRHDGAFRPARWLGLFGVALGVFRLVRRRRAQLAAQSNRLLRHPIVIDPYEYDVTHGGPRLARPCSDAEWFDDRQVRP